MTIPYEDYPVEKWLMATDVTATNCNSYYTLEEVWPGVDDMKYVDMYNRFVLAKGMLPK